MGWKKIITSLSNAVLNSLTTTGNVTVDGDLSADLPSDSVNNGLVVVQDPNTKKLFKTGSYGVGGDGGNVNFNVGGTTGTLTNLNITDYATDVATSLENGTLTITFGTPQVHTVDATTVSGFSTNRFNQQNDSNGYTINWDYDLKGNTFVSGYLQRAAVNGTDYENVYSFSNGTKSRTVNSSWNGDTATNLLQGSHRFRVVVTATLANGEDQEVAGGTVDKSLSKTDPGNATFTKTRSFDSGVPSSAEIDDSPLTIEEGATGTVVFTRSNGSNNGWTNKGWNQDEDSNSGASTTSFTVNRDIDVTGGGSTGDYYQHWDSSNLNSPKLYREDLARGSFFRFISFRHGMSTKTSWTTAELQDLDGWPGTIRWGNETFTSGWNANNPNGKYVYFVYKKTLGNISSLYVDGNVQTGAFIPTNVGNYKVYKSEYQQYLTLSNITINW